MTAVSPRPRNVGAAVIGGALEWYDILVYAYCVTEIAANFFPSSSTTSSLLLAYGTFGLSFIARPLGAVLLGRIADRSGRRTALVTTSVLMGFGTLTIALLPPSSAIGFAAPLLLLIARLVQGFSAGGEFGSATAYLAEQVEGRRAFYSSLQFASQGLGMASAALVGLALSRCLTAADVVAWGWRVPFAVGALFGPVAYYLRKRADETGEFLAIEGKGDARVATSWSASLLSRCLIGAGAVFACTVPIYFLVYIPTFARSYLHADPSIGYATALISGMTLTIGSPLAGLMADRFGALRLGFLSVALQLLAAYPIFATMIAQANKGSILLGQLAFSIATALYLGALPSILANLFATRNRSFGLAVSYNLAVMTGGGFAQAIFVLLIGWTGDRVAPSYYVVLACAIGLLSLLVCRRLGSGRSASGALEEARPA